MDEEALRKLAADSMAQGFIVEILLARYFRSFEPDYREGIARDLLSSGTRTDHFVGLAQDEATAEWFSDVVVKMHDMLGGYVHRAMARIEYSDSKKMGEEPQS